MDISSRILTTSFFNRSAVLVARDLIGCVLVRQRGKKVLRFMIIETEAYEGYKDKASHASHGKTKRKQGRKR